jgi:hypothetical protein
MAPARPLEAWRRVPQPACQEVHLCTCRPVHDAECLPSVTTMLQALQGYEVIQRARTWAHRVVHKSGACPPMVVSDVAAATTIPRL